MGQAETKVSFWCDPDDDTFFLETKIGIPDCNVISILFTEKEEGKWNVEWVVDWDTLSDVQKIQLFNASYQHLLTILIWLGYPDAVSDVRVTQLSWLKAMQRVVNGPIKPTYEEYCDEFFFFLMRNSDYNRGKVYKIDNIFNASELRGCAPRGRSLLLSDYRTVKFCPYDCATFDRTLIEEAPRYPETLEAAKLEIRDAHDKIVRRIRSGWLAPIGPEEPILFYPEDLIKAKTEIQEAHDDDVRRHRIESININLS